MKSYYRFSIIIALIALLATLSCLPSTSERETASPGNTAGADTTVPSVEPSNNPVAAPNVPIGDNAISSDPVSGQSEEVDLRWQELCMSSEYQVQIAKDPNFTIIVLDTGAFEPASSGSPGAYIPSGGRTASPSSLNMFGNLEAGHTYY